MFWQIPRALPWANLRGAVGTTRETSVVPQERRNLARCEASGIESIIRDAHHKVCWNENGRDPALLTESD